MAFGRAEDIQAGEGVPVAAVEAAIRLWILALGVGANTERAVSARCKARNAMETFDASDRGNQPKTSGPLAQFPRL